MEQHKKATADNEGLLPSRSLPNFHSLGEKGGFAALGTLEYLASLNVQLSQSHAMNEN
jgi:hypothetical protein